MQKIPHLSDSYYETQDTLTFKKGTKVRVVKLYQQMIESLSDFHKEYHNYPDEGWKQSAQHALQEIEYIKNAVGRDFVVEKYCLGANPHILNVDGIEIGFPTDCLEEVT